MRNLACIFGVVALSVFAAGSVAFAKKPANARATPVTARPASTETSSPLPSRPDVYPDVDAGQYEVEEDARLPEGVADVNTRYYLSPPADLTLDDEGKRLSEALSHFAVGGMLQDVGEETTALDHFQRTLDLDASQVDLATRIATLLVRRGDIPRALNVLKDSIKANPKESSIYRYLSFLLHRYQGKTAQAVEYARQAIDVAPGDFQNHAVLYEIYEDSGEIEKAYWVLRNAADLEIDDPQLWVQLGQAYWRHLLEYSSANYEEELGRLNSYFAKAEELAGNDVAVMDQVANFYISSDQRPLAIQLFRRILEIEPNYMLVRDRLAHNLIEENLVDEAIEVLENTARLDPYRYETFLQLAELYKSKGNYEKALSYLRSCLDINMQNPLLLMNVSEMHLLLRQPADALDIINLAREKFPELPEFMILKSHTLMDLEKYEEAFESFGETEEFIEPRYPQLATSDFYFYYGAAAERARKMDVAEELLRKSIELDPENAKPYNYLGYTWIDQDKNLDEAAMLVNRALQLDPENPAYLDSLGWYYYRKGDYEQALTKLQRSKELIVDADEIELNWEVFDHLGDTYAKLNKTAEALEHWEIARKNAPENRKEKISGKIQTLHDEKLADIEGNSSERGGKVLTNSASTGRQ